MVRTRLNIGCRYSTPVRERPLHPTRSHFTPEPSQTQAPVTPATEPERRAGGSLTTFHTAEWSARPEILDSLSDARLRVLGERLIYTEAYEVMPAPARNAHDVALARRLMAGEGTVPWLTLPKAVADTDDFIAVAGGVEAALLRDLRDYLAQQAEEAGALIA